ncbi:hypothetical protein Tco_1045187 [Tanacetum coccineum]|uniref:Copia protein n=1 Tax=Tanacetum coccineum TaxID=301880 RepID=A0ABQ5GTZ4_9ASTR
MGSNSFVPMDSEEKVQRLKRAGQDVEAEPAKRQRTKEVSEDDLVKLWGLVQERYNSSGLTEDKETELWKQTALAISTTEAEYVSTGKACQQALWMKQALVDYGVGIDDILIMCDNKGAIDLSKNTVQHSQTKQIEIRHHFLRDNIQKGNISIEKVSSEDNISDILTKPLKREPFNYLCLGLGMMEQIN